MAVNNPPYALQNGSHSAALFRQAVSSNVAQGGVMQPSATASAELFVAQSGTPAMSVQISAGRAWVPGSQVGNIVNGWSTQAQYFCLNDAAVTVTIAAADPVNPRIDSVYFAIQDSFYSGSNNQGVLGVVTGTPAPSPSAPAIPSNAILLAYVAVAANATSIVNANITDERPLLSTYNGITRCSSSANYPSSPLLGQYIDNSSAGLLRYDGTGWTDYRDRGFTSADYNTLTNPGVYRATGSTNAPSPTSGIYHLLVEWIQEGAVIRQTAYLEADTAVFSRTNVSGTWGGWRRLTSDAGLFNVTYSSSAASSATINFNVAFPVGATIGVSLDIQPYTNNTPQDWGLTGVTNTGFTYYSRNPSGGSLSGTLQGRYVAQQTG